jgi:tripartite-type tricarboxylate transporter receptor subunit TctC
MIAPNYSFWFKSVQLMAHFLRSRPWDTLWVFIGSATKLCPPLSCNASNEIVIMLHSFKAASSHGTFFAHRLRQFVLSLCVASLAFTVAVPSIAQTYPAKPLRLLAGFGAGAGSDAMVRQVSALMASQLGQAVNVENKPSSGSLSAAADMASAPADGYTLFAADNGFLVYNPALYKKLSYDPAVFAPIGVIARAPLMLVTHPGAGFKHVRDMLDKAKTSSSKIAYASPGTGSPFHLAMELLKNRAGVPLARVPFGSDAAALKDVLAGQVDLAVIDLPSAMPHIRSGKLQVLATFASKRLNVAPDAPALNELGYKDIEAYLWQSLVVHAATPKEIQARLSQAMQAALAQSAVRKNLPDNGWEILASDAGLMSAFVAADTRVWHRIIKEGGITAD